MTNVLALAEIASSKLPVASVDVPLVVPFTKTEAPGTGFPEPSVTLPEIFFPCAITNSEAKTAPKSSNTIFLMLFGLV